MCQPPCKRLLQAYRPKLTPPGKRCRASTHRSHSYPRKPLHPTPSCPGKPAPAGKHEDPSSQVLAAPLGCSCAPPMLCAAPDNPRNSATLPARSRSQAGRPQLTRLGSPAAQRTALAAVLRSSYSLHSLPAMTVHGCMLAEPCVTTIFAGSCIAHGTTPATGPSCRPGTWELMHLSLSRASARCAYRVPDMEPAQHSLACWSDSAQACEGTHRPRITWRRRWAAQRPQPPSAPPHPAPPSSARACIVRLPGRCLS